MDTTGHLSPELAIEMLTSDRAIMLDPVSRSIIAEGKPSELRDQSDDPRVRQFFNRQSNAAMPKVIP